MVDKKLDTDISQFCNITGASYVSRLPIPAHRADRGPTGP